MNNITISYLTMRKFIGILALAFPFLLVIGGLFSGTPLQYSLSSYYWTNAIVPFTGMLITFGVFLLAYHGYDKKDNTITTIAGIAMLTTALFPMLGPSNNYLFAFIPGEITGIMHYISATTTFSSLGIMSFFQFTKSSVNQETTIQKERRNIIYRVCGISIFASIILMVPALLIPFTAAFFWLECIVLWAFGISWLVKGEAILKDK